MRRFVEKFLWTLNQVMAWICYALLGVIVSVILFQIALRFVFRSPIGWSEEIALLLLTWFGMIAVAVGVYRHNHLAIMMLRNRLPPFLRTALDIFAQVLIAVFGAILFWCGFDLVKLAGTQVLPASEIAKFWLYCPVPIGGGLLFLNAAGNIISGRWISVRERRQL